MDIREVGNMLDKRMLTGDPFDQQMLTDKENDQSQFWLAFFCGARYRFVSDRYAVDWSVLTCSAQCSVSS